MPTVDFKIRIGCNEAEAQNPSTIKFQVEAHKEKIESHINKLGQILDKHRLPTIVVELPPSLTTIPIEILESPDEELAKQIIHKNGKAYHCIEFRVQEIQILLKKIQKIFQPITELENNLFLNLHLHNVDNYQEQLKEKKIYPFCIFFQNVKIEGRADLDNQIYKTMGEVLSKISPSFADSPFMAILPLFQGFDFELEFDSLSELKEATMEKLFQQSRYEEPDDDEEGKAMQIILSSKEPVNIYVHFQHLGYLHIQFEARLFGYFICSHFGNN